MSINCKWYRKIEGGDILLRRIMFQENWWTQNENLNQVTRSYNTQKKAIFKEHIKIKQYPRNKFKFLKWQKRVCSYWSKKQCWKYATVATLNFEWVLIVWINLSIFDISVLCFKLPTKYVDFFINFCYNSM